jgi:tRNA pseudouridine13 synthase
VPTAATIAEPVDLATAHGVPPIGGRLRAEPEDFVVDEILGFEPDGTGDHVLLRVEKRDANSGWVAAELARATGTAVRDVGFSGQKDRHALTRQFYSLPWRGSASLDACRELRGEGWRVLEVARHGRKLRPGSHRANRFEIRVRGVTGDLRRLETRLEAVARLGVPNYFGPQRFGRQGANLERARRWAGDGVPPRDRSQRAFALSAARSDIFNRVLDERVRHGSWNRLLPGEAVILDGRRSFFRAPDIDAELEDRCARLDVHPSGPLWGRGETPATGEARAAEDAVSAVCRELCGLLETQRLEQERRALRLPAHALGWQLAADILTLSFELPRGSFATAVLHELLADAWDPAENGED